MSEIKQIIKRDGRTVDFDISKISDAIYKAAEVLGGQDRDTSNYLARQVELYLTEVLHNEIPTVEQIQDTVVFFELRDCVTEIGVVESEAGDQDDGFTVSRLLIEQPHVIHGRVRHDAIPSQAPSQGCQQGAPIAEVLSSFPCKDPHAPTGFRPRAPGESPGG